MLRVSFVTPLRVVTQGEVMAVTAPSVEGELGILPDHLPLLARMKPGCITLKRGSGEEHFAVSGGFVEVARNKITIMADTAEAAEEIDKKRSEKALKSAEEELKKLDALSDEYREQHERAARARVRMAVADRKS